MSVALPPSPRDFEIHRLHLVYHMSTWRLAEKYEVSQTRIRQIVKRVSQWLTETMPVKTEAELEKETRLAQHIAADQLQHQLELLQNYFDGSGDTKYSRQQTRVILALARLGTLPGSIEAHAADAEDRGIGVPPVQNHSAPQPLTTEFASPTSDLRPLTSDLYPPPPPVGDFSPSTNSAATESSTPDPDRATTPLHETPSRKIEFPYEDALAGLCIMEKRLLTLIDNTTHDDPERLESLNKSLANVRHQKATLELRLSPNQPGATVTTNDQTAYFSPSDPHSPLPVVAALGQDSV